MLTKKGQVKISPFVYFVRVHFRLHLIKMHCWLYKLLVQANTTNNFVKFIALHPTDR